MSLFSMLHLYRQIVVCAQNKTSVCNILSHAKHFFTLKTLLLFFYIIFVLHVVITHVLTYAVL
jgi:hypothetical protein